MPSATILARCTLYSSAARDVYFASVYTHQEIGEGGAQSKGGA